MPIFWILVVLVLCFAWLILSFCFKPLGCLARRLWEDAQRAMSEDDEKDTYHKESDET